MSNVPVSVMVCTRNEAGRMASCLSALAAFDDVVVIDSGSTDDTVLIAQSFGARAVPFIWNGQYPKKRQWCLDYLELAHDWVFFVDADEIVTSVLADEIRRVMAAPAHQGYFVEGQYVMDGKILRFGLKNSKIVLFDRRKFSFPDIPDLYIPGMGEMEGHYQPLPDSGATIGRIKSPLLHYAYDGGESWDSRHQRYAQWEAGMNTRNAWPDDPVRARQVMKQIFRGLPFRPLAAFLHCYVAKLGFLDGGAGFRLARDRYRYYAMVVRNCQ